MLRTIAKRLVACGSTLLVLTLLIFGLVKLAPGTPLAETLDTGLGRLPPDVQAELERVYHLDEPLHRQYLLWLGGVLRGDLGRSFHDRRPVLDKIVERLDLTVLINGAALLLMVAVSVPLGALAAARPGSWVDRGVAVTTYLAYSLPVFWTALLLQLFFSMQLGWLPLSGVSSERWDTLGPAASLVDRALHLVLPVVCLSYGGLAYLSRFVRATLVESALADSALAARARGVGPWSILMRHGFRLAALPMLTLAGLLLPALVGGSAIVESIFAVPGFGRLFVEAALQRDLPVVLALTLLTGTATVLGTLAADLAYFVADPRVRRG